MPAIHGWGHSVLPTLAIAQQCEPASAPELLFDLHGRILRLAASHSGRRFQGLAYMGRVWRFSGKIQKELVKLDATVAYLKNITVPLAEAFLAEVAVDLG